MTATGRLQGRIALVTGASRGIGRAVALRFAQEGAHVIAVARTQGGLEELDDEIRAAGGAATLVPLDLLDLDQIDQVGAAVFERWKKLDVLVGNHGLLGTLGPITHQKPDEFEQVIAANLTSQWRLLRSMDPLLRASDAGRAIFTTSTVGHVARAYWAAYSVSKAALEMMVKIYAAETVKTNVRANLINPGATRTTMRAHAYPGEDPATLKPPEAVAGLYLDLADPACTRHGEVFEHH